MLREIGVFGGGEAGFFFGAGDTEYVLNLGGYEHVKWNGMEGGLTLKARPWVEPVSLVRYFSSSLNSVASGFTTRGFVR